jgi:hypothetical protein
MTIRYFVALLAVLLAGLSLACGSSGATVNKGISEAQEAALVATQSPDQSREPGRLRATLEASCRLGEYSAEMDLDYRARGEGESLVTRVRLLINDRVELDTGQMSEPDWWGNRTVKVVAGRRYMVQLVADSPGAPSTSARSNVRCPIAPARDRL